MTASKLKSRPLHGRQINQQDMPKLSHTHAPRKRTGCRHVSEILFHVLSELKGAAK